MKDLTRQSTRTLRDKAAQGRLLLRYPDGVSGVRNQKGDSP